MTSRIRYSTSGARVGATSSAMLDASPRPCAATVTLSGEDAHGGACSRPCSPWTEPALRLERPEAVACAPELAESKTEGAWALQEKWRRGPLAHLGRPPHLGITVL